MDVQEFSEEEWQDILDEFRLLVLRAGYADWDSAMAAALVEDGDESDGPGADHVLAQPAVEQLRRYTGAFMSFLKARSRYALAMRREQLGSLLRNEGGEPVRDVVFEVEGRERSIFENDDGTDAMIDVLQRFLTTIHGDGDAFWDDARGDPESK